jgi:hypothetical protein
MNWKKSRRKNERRTIPEGKDELGFNYREAVFGMKNIAYLSFEKIKFVLE